MASDIIHDWVQRELSKEIATTTTTKQSAELREVTDAELAAEDEKAKLQPAASFCQSASSLSSISSMSRRSMKKTFDFSLD